MKVIVPDIITQDQMLVTNNTTDQVTTPLDQDLKDTKTGQATQDPRATFSEAMVMDIMTILG